MNMNSVPVSGELFNVIEQKMPVWSDWDESKDYLNYIANEFFCFKGDFLVVIEVEIINSVGTKWVRVLTRHGIVWVSSYSLNTSAIRIK